MRATTPNLLLMKRIKFIKNVKGYRAGEVVFVTPNEAHGFLDAGDAVLTKDMVSEDTREVKTPQKGSVRSK